MTDNIQQSNTEQQNIEPSRFEIFVKQTWPRTSRIIYSIFYSTVMFFRSLIKFISSQIKGY